MAGGGCGPFPPSRELGEVTARTIEAQFSASRPRIFAGLAEDCVLAYVRANDHARDPII